MKTIARWMTYGLLLLIAGCGGDSAKSLYSEVVDSNAKRLGGLYLQFQVRNAKKPMLGPESVEEFKSFISAIDEERLELIGISKNGIDDLFVSERDNAPYKIRLEVQGVIRGPAQPVIFEETGVDGKYVVAFTGFNEQLVDKDEYDRLMSGEADNGDQQ